jgi:hypothetical protein
MHYVSRVHAPALLRPGVQAAVLAVFAGAFLLSLGALPRLSKCALSTELPSSACNLLQDLLILLHADGLPSKQKGASLGRVGFLQMAA